GRFVEQQQFGIGHQRACDLDALAFAFGQGAEGPLGQMRDVERRQQIVCTVDIVLVVLLDPPTGDSVGGGEHGVEHRFGLREATGQRRRGVADARPQFEHVDPSEALFEDADRAGCRVHASGGEFEQGRLARTVGSEHGPVLALGDGQREIFEEELGSSAHGHGFQSQDITHILRLYRRQVRLFWFDMDPTTDSLLLTLAINHRLRSTLPPLQLSAWLLDVLTTIAESGHHSYPQTLSQAGASILVRHGPNDRLTAADPCDQSSSALDPAPDEVSAAFLDDDRDVPLIVSDEVFATPAPTGLLLFVAEAAAAGIPHARLALHHPPLPHTTPPVDRAARTKVGRHSAPVVLHRGPEQAAIALVGAEADVEIIACRPTLFRPVTVGTSAEA